MKMHLEKSMRILNDLMAFCHSLGAKEYDIHLAHEGDISRLHISSPIPDASPQAVEELREALNLPRQHEVEQNYWELSGDSEIEGELTLVGMMLDEAVVEYTGGVLSVKAWRRES